MYSQYFDFYFIQNLWYLTLGTLFLEFWKRKEAALQFKWDLTDFVTEEVKYHGSLIIFNLIFFLLLLIFVSLWAICEFVVMIIGIKGKQ